ARRNGPQGCETGTGSADRRLDRVLDRGFARHLDLLAVDDDGRRTGDAVFFHLRGRFGDLIGHRTVGDAVGHIGTGVTRVRRELLIVRPGRPLVGLVLEQRLVEIEECGRTGSVVYAPGRIRRSARVLVLARLVEERVR